MKHSLLFLIIVLSASCSSGSKKTESNQSAILSDSLTDQEGEYLKTRDAYIQQFTQFEKSAYNDSVSNLHSQALLNLESKLREILKDSRYSDQGEINLRALIPSLGFGMLDGLWIEKDSMSIFYTSKNLFYKNFNIELTPNAFGAIYQNAFFDDAAVENFYSFRINFNKNIEAFGTIGLVTQMKSPFPPNYLFVFIIKDRFVYMIAKEIKGEPYELPHCKLISDGINSEAQKYGERYRSSNLKDTAAINEEFRLEEVAYKKYMECYQKEITGDPKFKVIQKKLEAMVKYLEP